MFSSAYVMVLLSPFLWATSLTGLGLGPLPVKVDNSFVPRQKIALIDLTEDSSHLQSYKATWELQRRLLGELCENTVTSQRKNRKGGCVIVVEHPPVVTLGTKSDASFLKFDPDHPPEGVDLFRVERGGEATYHGPGQLVLYPILDLRRYHMDLHWYLRQLEEVVIRTICNLNIGLGPERKKGLTGVWVNEHKVAAVGIKVKRWCTMHGVSLNVSCKSSDFSLIVPCGISNRPVASLKELSTAPYKEMDLFHVKHKLLAAFAEVFESDIVRVNLKDA